MHRAVSHGVVILAETLGVASLVLFAVFVFAGPIWSVRLGFGALDALAWDALLSLLFFAQHSLMVRRWFKDWLAARWPREFHGAIYAIGSGVALAIAMVFWQPVPTVVAAAGGWLAWLLRGLAVAAIAGFVWGVRSLRSFDTFGRGPIIARLRGQTPEPSTLIVRGPYQWVRHPLMFFMLVLIWANPHVTADRALFNVLWTLWLVIGTRFEERDLVAEFGESYRAYQRLVPMLLPWRGPAGRALRSRVPAVAPSRDARRGGVIDCDPAGGDHAKF